MHMSARAHALRISALTYPGSIEHVSTVRADLRALLPDCPAADDVILCASELAANAALHSHSRLPGGTFALRAAIHPGCHVQIEVEDNGGRWITPPDEPNGHHGLDIVRVLAKEWGVNGGHAARTIWARFDWSE
jgi:serine/threonine-protein kinase RsbW